MRLSEIHMSAITLREDLLRRSYHSYRKMKVIMNTGEQCWCHIAEIRQEPAHQGKWLNFVYILFPTNLFTHGYHGACRRLLKTRALDSLLRWMLVCFRRQVIWILASYIASKVCVFSPRKHFHFRKIPMAPALPPSVRKTQGAKMPLRNNVSSFYRKR